MNEEDAASAGAGVGGGGDAPHPKRPLYDQDGEGGGDELVPVAQDPVQQNPDRSRKSPSLEVFPPVDASCVTTSDDCGGASACVLPGCSPSIECVDRGEVSVSARLQREIYE